MSKGGAVHAQHEVQGQETYRSAEVSISRKGLKVILIVILIRYEPEVTKKQKKKKKGPPTVGGPKSSN